MGRDFNLLDIVCPKCGNPHVLLPFGSYNSRFDEGETVICPLCKCHWIEKIAGQHITLEPEVLRERGK